MEILLFFLVILLFRKKTLKVAGNKMNYPPASKLRCVKNVIPACLPAVFLEGPESFLKHTPLYPLLIEGTPEGFSPQASRRGDTPSGNDRQAGIFTPMKGIEEFYS